MGKALPTRQKRHVKQIPKMEEWSKNQPDRQKDNCQTSSTRMAKESGECPKVCVNLQTDVR